MSDTVLVEDQGAVRVLTLNRPTKLNAMNVELVDTLIGAVRAADQDDAVAVLILTGAGRAFSAGADISRGTTEPSDTVMSVNAGLRHGRPAPPPR
ncbi:MAG TPA: enoyl-CoA hydratase/isomerase family protein [Vicinamibacterales bacterium]|nr:enoyl-CoA hydratase/isomerase family protein [Vicinamibacterales bacterium]